jgi:hypothetical protein
MRSIDLSIDPSEMSQLISAPCLERAAGSVALLNYVARCI